jgi:hypothetical protein
VLSTAMTLSVPLREKAIVRAVQLQLWFNHSWIIRYADDLIQTSMLSLFFFFINIVVVGRSQKSAGSPYYSIGFGDCSSNRKGCFRWCYWTWYTHRWQPADFHHNKEWCWRAELPTEARLEWVGDNLTL